MPQNVSNDHSFEGNEVKELTLSFFSELSKRVVDSIETYASNFELTDYGIWSEQQIKTFITYSLFGLTSGATVQEFSARRNYDFSSNRPDWESSGKIDYFSVYKEVTFLIEVKHSWCRFYFNDDFSVQKISFEESPVNQLNKGFEQIKSIQNKRSLVYNKDLVGLSVVSVPIFIRSKEPGFLEKLMHRDMKPLINSFVKERIAQHRAAKHNITHVTIVLFETKYLNVLKFNNSFELYPGVIFLGSAKELKRNR